MISQDEPTTRVLVYNVGTNVIFSHKCGKGESDIFKANYEILIMQIEFDKLFWLETLRYMKLLT